MPFPDNKVFGIAAAIVSIAAFVPYVSSILNGRTRPSGPSWWTWSILMCVTVASSWYAGASFDVLILPIWLCFSQVFVAILSLKRGDNTWDVWNRVCVAGAGLGIVLWLITGQPLVALVSSLIADILATVPTFRHAWTSPHEENRLGWTLGWVSAVLLIFAIDRWTIAESGWSIYFVLCMSVIVFLVWRPALKNLVPHTN